jgi:trimethylamine:corrinoid methyltransferase-like protein
MRQLRHQADYLGQEHTLRWFPKEFYLPSEVIDRGAFDAWQARGAPSAFERAHARVELLLAEYCAPTRSKDLGAELRRIATSAARRFGMDELPAISS